MQCVTICILDACFACAGASNDRNWIGSGVMRHVSLLCYAHVCTHHPRLMHRRRTTVSALEEPQRMATARWHLRFGVAKRILTRSCVGSNGLFFLSFCASARELELSARKPTSAIGCRLDFCSRIQNFFTAELKRVRVKLKGRSS